MPRVSVIIPNFNHAKFLRKRIDSVLGQTFRDFEIICMDDASTDGSAAIIREFAKSGCFREVLINTQNSGGPFKQWNKGVRAVRGEYVWIAESDDWADADFLQTLVRELDGNSHAGLAFCESMVVDESGSALGAWNELHPGAGQFWSHSRGGDGRAAILNSMVFESTIPNASAILFRRELYEKAGGVDESMRLCGDYLLWVRMLLMSGAVFVPRVLNYFRRHSATARNKHSLSAKAMCERCSVVRLITESLEVPAATLETVAEEIARTWLDAERAPSVRLSLRAHLAVYLALKSFDAGATTRVTSRLRYHLRRAQIPARRAVKTVLGKFSR